MRDWIDALLAGEPHAAAAASLALSILLYIIWSNAGWYFRTGSEGSWRQRLSAQAGWPSLRALYEVLRLGFYLGLPYIALLSGWVDIRAAGLGFLDWANGLRWTILLSLAAWSILMFVWVPYLRATATIPVAIEGEASNWGRRIVEAVYQQAHWAFYRAVCIILLAVRFDEPTAWYWGTTAGLGLVFLEAWLDPRVRRHVAQFGEGELTLWNAGQAVINAVGYVLTRNNWLLVLVHLALEFTVPHLRTASQLTSARRRAPTVDAVRPR